MITHTKLSEFLYQMATGKNSGGRERERETKRAAD
jgi:hypothetical protein